MPNVVSISAFQPQSFSICLRRLYRKLDRTSIETCKSLEFRKDFFIKSRGEFLSISRKKKNISIEVAAQYLRVSPEIIEKIETGNTPIYDPTFLKLCAYYGTLNDAFLLTEKIERALNPRLRETQKKTSEDFPGQQAD